VNFVALVAGAVGVGVCLLFLPTTLQRPPHARENYRGRIVFGTAGIVLVVPLVIGAGLAFGVESRATDVVLTMLCAGVLFAVLGYVDDVCGSRHAGGFIGHARELFHGRLTTGSVKALGGGVIGLVSAWTVGRRGLWILVGGAVVALSANLANLLDLRPGRTLKVWLPSAVALIVAGVPNGTDSVIASLGGGAALFGYYELHERVMLGDTGAGTLGGVLGVGAVAALGTTALLVALGVLLVLTAVSEAVSFSRVIEVVPPLRWADRLGRRD
jgi:UDP-N-acetylmuramyl pentapeptide phosphotransferase/UDP-N-acetylglucosamine-1-phosphate transferase